MAALTTQNIGYAGTKPTTSSVSASDTAEVGPKNFAVYRTGGNQITLEIQVPSSLTPYTQVDNDVSYTLAAAANSELWIPLHSDYNDGTGRCTITATGTLTSATVSIVKAGWTE